MQKNIIAKIFAITIAVSCMLTGFFVVSGKKVNAAETYTVIEQLPDAERFVINKVSYRQDNITNSNLTFEGASNQTNVFNMSAALSPDSNVAKGEDVMLNNYGNNQSTDSYEMLLISFGDINGSYNADMTKVLYTHIVSVTLDVNGNSYDISTSDNYFGGKTETGYTNYPSLTDQDLGLQLGSNKMVETSNIVTSQFTTLLDLNALGINSLIEEGHYTISFNFSYMVCDYVDGQESNPQVVNNVKYVYDFYLFSNTNFAQQYKDYNNYPEFLGYNINESNDANDFVISPEGTMTYYDYNNRLLSPTLQYDAENYNLSYTKKRTTTDTYTTELTNGTGDTKILTTYKNGNFAFYQELSPTVIDGVKRYIVNYDFSDMSTYNLHFAYQIKADNGYRILDNEGYTAVMYNGKSSLKGEILHPDQAILHVYGVRTYMTGAKPTFFAQDGYTFNADFTARYYLYSTIGTIDNTHLYASMYDYWNDADLTKEYQYDSTSDMLFPEINLSSLYFDVYGVANFEDNQPTSTITRYSNLDDMIAGVDEVGRGPLVGPVVAACVILPKEFSLEGLTDSKKLSEKKREFYYDEIMRQAISVGVGIISEEKIDEVNIYEATKLAMREAISKCSVRPEHILIDAMPLSLDIPTTSIIKGDFKSITISAASVIAKVTRDRMLDELDKKYPMYDFKDNKGYPTKKHLEAIEKYGIIPEHRKSYGPVRDYLEKQLSLF